MGGASRSRRVVFEGLLMANPTIEEDLTYLRRAVNAAIFGIPAEELVALHSKLDRIEAALKGQKRNPWGDDGHHVYDVIRQRYRGGETVHELAVDYGCTTEDIARALVDPHNQCPTATCARNAGHARRQGSDRGSTV